ADARHGFNHRVRVLVDSEDFGAFMREQHRGGAAVTPARPDASGSDNQRDLALDPSRHRLSLFASARMVEHDGKSGNRFASDLRRHGVEPAKASAAPSLPVSDEYNNHN